MAMSTNLIRATTDMLILALLREGTSYGYELNKQAHRLSGGAVRWVEGALYPALTRLRTKGLVTSQWSGPANGRKRRIYSLTAKGRRGLALRASEWTAFVKATDSILRG